jgi:hypothetical protein
MLLVANQLKLSLCAVNILESETNSWVASSAGSSSSRCQALLKRLAPSLAHFIRLARHEKSLGVWNSSATKWFLSQPCLYRSIF